MIYDALRTIAGLHVGTAAIVGSGSAIRMYAIDTPEDGTFPCVVYQRISSSPRHHLTANSGLATDRFQFTCWAASAKAARELGEQLRLALDDYTGSSAGTTVTLVEHANGTDIGSDSADFEGIRYYGSRMDFMVTYQETIP